MNLSNRELTHTQVTKYKERLDIWQASVDACYRQIELAVLYQEAGENIIHKLQSLKEAKEIEPSKLMNYYNKCLVNIQKGAEMERAARRELFNLQHCEPKQR